MAETKSALVVFRDLVEKQTSQFLAAMNNDENVVNRFKRILLTNFQERAEVRQCDPMSVLHVAMRAAQDGLMLDGVEAAVVPFKDRDRGTVTATYVPMIMGIRKKVRNSGQILDWTVTAVFEGDECRISLGTNESVDHKPLMTGGRRRPLLGVYSIVHFRGGGQSLKWMGRDEIEDIRSKSKAKTGPWTDPVFYPEMAVKTCARAHAKQLPQSSDMQAFWARDDQDNGPAILDGSAMPSASTPKRIASVADALDEFGAGTDAPKLSAPEESQAPHRESGDGGATGGTDERPRRGPESPKLAASNAGDIDAIKRAYRRGQDDRKAGKPDTVPDEYATNDRNKEQLAWWSGYDGKPLPSWGAQT